MAWEKQGLVYATSGEQAWSRSHTQVPSVHDPGDGTWRVYYATRDGSNRSRPSFVDVRAGSPRELLEVHDRPVLDLGAPGAFDDCGVMPSCVVDSPDGLLLYYTGWTHRVTVPYHNAIGLALSRDGGRHFERLFEGPILGPTATEPYITGSPYVRIENGVWRMWYFSATHWADVDGRLEPFYRILYAESRDGVQWRREGTVSVDFRSDSEAGVGRSAVLHDGQRYRSWYSFREAAGYRTERVASYRIGYADSDDGIRWQRRDLEGGLDVSASGWDSEMVAYPSVATHEGRTYLFYNGNGFGRTGFGVAVERR